jgi:hypothetical protein
VSPCQGLTYAIRCNECPLAVIQTGRKKVHVLCIQLAAQWASRRKVGINSAALAQVALRFQHF